MNLSPPAPRAVIFDYGNTVIPFGLPEIRRIDDVLGAARLAVLEVDAGLDVGGLGGTSVRFI